MPNVHYNISPSQLHRWLACHAAFQEERKYPEQPGGPAAVDGTHTHTLIEKCLTAEGGILDAMFFIGEELEDHEGKFTVDLDRVQRANVCVHYVQQRQQELKPCAVRAEEVSNAGSFLVRLNQYWDDWKGTCDVTLVSDKVLEVIDYKDGRSPQDVVFNPQLLSYMLGRIDEYVREGDEVHFETLRMTIIQPRCNPPISHHDVQPEDLWDFAAKVREWRAIAEGPNPEFNPGEKQCKWCNAKSGCSALMNKSLEGVQMGFQNLEVAQQAADKEPSAMTDEQLREFFEAIPLLKQAIQAAEEEALRRFKTGHKIAGLKAVRGRGQRQWAFSDDEMPEKLKRFGIPKSVIFVTKVVSPAQVEKLSWEKRDGTKHTLSKRQLETLKKEYIEYKQGKVTIVPESDEREEVVFGAENLFSAQTDTIELPDALSF